jgi:hypothetical protein
VKSRNTPQEKKIKDYQNQRANSYGENDKSSRKAIRLNKAIVNRTFRRKIHDNLQQVCSCNDNDLAQENIVRIKRKNWKKKPDYTIVESLTAEYNHDNPGWDFHPKSSLQKEAIKRLRKSNKLRSY